QNPNAFAFQLLMPLALLFGWRLPRSARGPLPWQLVGAVVLLATVVLTRSRAGLLRLVGALVLAAVLHVVPPRVLLARRTLVVAPVAGAALVVVGLAAWGTVDRLTAALFGAGWRPLADESDALRWQTIALGWQAWLQHPVLGLGLGTFMLSREAAGSP